MQVLLVLGVGGLTEVCKPVVMPHTIDVINVPLGPNPVNMKPSQAMRAVDPSVDADEDVSGVGLK